MSCVKDWECKKDEGGLRFAEGNTATYAMLHLVEVSTFAIDNEERNFTKTRRLRWSWGVSLSVFQSSGRHSATSLHNIGHSRPTTSQFPLSAHPTNLAVVSWKLGIIIDTSVERICVSLLTRPLAQWPSGQRKRPSLALCGHIVSTTLWPHTSSETKDISMGTGTFARKDCKHFWPMCKEARRRGTRYTKGMLPMTLTTFWSFKEMDNLRRFMFNWRKYCLWGEDCHSKLVSIGWATLTYTQVWIRGHVWVLKIEGEYSE